MLAHGHTEFVCSHSLFLYRFSFCLVVYLLMFLLRVRFQGHVPQLCHLCRPCDCRYCICSNLFRLVNFRVILISRCLTFFLHYLKRLLFTYWNLFCGWNAFPHFISPKKKCLETQKKKGKLTAITQKMTSFKFVVVCRICRLTASPKNQYTNSLLCQYP